MPAVRDSAGVHRGYVDRVRDVTHNREPVHAQRAEAKAAVAAAKAGGPGRFVAMSHSAASTPKRWGVQVTPITGAEGRPAGQTVVRVTPHHRNHPTQTENFVLNLAKNAPDAMGVSGKPTLATADVTFDAAFAKRRVDLQPGDHVRLAVSGSGMTTGVVAQVFEPFYFHRGIRQRHAAGLVDGVPIRQTIGRACWSAQPARRRHDDRAGFAARRARRRHSSHRAVRKT